MSFEDIIKRGERAIAREIGRTQPAPVAGPAGPPFDGSVPVIQQSPSSQQEVPPVTTQQPLAQPRPSFGQAVHRDVSVAATAIQRVWQITVQLATNPAADELAEEIMLALNQGVAAEVFQAATDGLRGARARKRGAVDQVAEAADAGQQAAHEASSAPSFTPAPDAGQQTGQPSASPRTAII